MQAAAVARSSSSHPLPLWSLGDAVMALGACRDASDRQRGAFLIIAAVFMLIVLVFMSMVFLTTFTTSTSTTMNELQSTQALFIAEGGLQYTLALNKTNIPNYSTNGTWKNLGAGQLKVDTPAYLTANIAAGAVTIPVDSTASFPTTGRLAIGNHYGITYTGKAATSFTGASGGLAHNQYDAVYPAARLSAVISAASCADLPTIDVAGDDTGGFDISFPFFIDTEYFFCAAKTQYQFQNCQRCYRGSSKAAHNTNSYCSQYMLTSTGRIPSGLATYAQRVVKISAGPEEF
jgi:Tfp pilus assembly protein PilX